MSSILDIKIGSSSLVLPYIELDLRERFYVKRTLEDFCRKRLTSYEFVRRANRYVADKQFFTHDEEKGIFYIPAPFLDQVKQYLTENTITYRTVIIDTHPVGNITFKMNDGCEIRENQIPAIKFLTDPPKQRAGLTLQTGMGKSFSAIRSVQSIGLVSMIMMNGLVDQWVREFRKFTNVGDKLYVIQGVGSLKKLFASDLRPEVFICSTGTLRPFIKGEGDYANLPSYAEFVKRYGIGVKVVDEAHLCFHASCKVDLAANIPYNIYLTATFNNDNSSIKKIFKSYFPNLMIFGGEDYERYTRSTFYLFAGTVPEQRCITPKGYNHAKYEDHLLKHPRLLFDMCDRILLPLVNSHYINKNYPPGKKLLIFCATVEMIQSVVVFLHDHCPNHKVMSYIFEDGEENLVDADIIVSTHKGSGTGKDIAGLMVVINTISFQASNMAIQALGRLRKPKDGLTPEYIDIADVNIASHMRHFAERKMFIKERSLEYKEYRL